MRVALAVKNAFTITLVHSSLLSLQPAPRVASVSGLRMLAAPFRYLLSKLSMPKKLISCYLVPGLGWVAMAATRASSGRMPSADTCCPRNSTEEAKNTHFSR